MIKKDFYEKLKNIVFSEFPTDGKLLNRADENARGTKNDDIVYAVLEKSRTLMSEDEYSLRKKIIIGKAIRLATSLYCENHTLKDISNEILIDFIHENNLIVTYTDAEKHIDYESSYNTDILFEIIRFDEQHVDIEAIVPKFITNRFSYDESKKKYVCYYDDRIVVTYSRLNK